MAGLEFRIGVRTRAGPNELDEALPCTCPPTKRHGVLVLPKHRAASPSLHRKQACCPANLGKEQTRSCALHWRGLSEKPPRMMSY